MLEDLRGKGALVTGASTGIGAAAAMALGGLGVGVAVHYNRSAAEAEAVAGRSGTAAARRCSSAGDLATVEAGAAVVARAVEALGGSTSSSTTRAR